MHLPMPVFLVMVVVLARPVVLLKCTYSPTPILLVVCVGVCFCFVFPQVPPFKILIHLNPSCNRLQSLIGKMNTNSGGGSSPSPGDYSKKKTIFSELASLWALAQICAGHMYDSNVHEHNYM
jgi:hypothetical protein